ncbi:hypothetical protein [Oscillibacter sp.]|uniref:hypothetical protein n=1 Tax=Oscillibacter sp. TaxID=1945593 RepID=UPI00289E5953|nr:hypothetical protein [Oscillibacter sp.]
MKHTALSFSKTNLQNIKGIFEEKTGVELPSRRTLRRPVRAAVILAAALVCCFLLAAFAVNLFSSLSGDDVGFSAAYEGNGIVSIVVENRSDKALAFQPKLKLMRWSTGEEIAQISDDVVFTGTKITANSSGTMTIDLSNAYDTNALEEPLTNDNYYFVLTNNNFLFGQDWMCTIWFSEPVVTPDAPIPPVQADETILRAIPEDLRDYFENITFDIDERRALNARYVQSYTNLFAQFDGTIVPSVSPLPLLVDVPSEVIFDSSVSEEGQRLLVGQHYSGSHANFKLLATKQETALTVSASLPLTNYTDADTGNYLPLFYIFMYAKEEINAEHDYAFIHGQIIRFSDLAQFKVYEDGQYICYEVSPLIYSDLTEYVQNFVSQNPDIRYDRQAQARVENIYHYYKEHLESLLFIKQTKQFSFPSAN